MLAEGRTHVEGGVYMYRKILKVFIWLLSIIVTIIIITGVGLYFYIQPEEPIALVDPVEVPLRERIEEMIQNRALRFTVTETEMNGYASEEIRKLQASQFGAEAEGKYRITGIKLSLEPDLVHVQAQTEAAFGIKAEVFIDLNLRWDEVNQQIHMLPTSFRVKNISLPVEWLPIPEQALTISLQPYLPRWVYVKELTLQDEGLLVQLGLNILN